MAENRNAHAKSHSNVSASVGSLAPRSSTSSRSVPKPQESGHSPKLARSVSNKLGQSGNKSVSIADQSAGGSGRPSADDGMKMKSRPVSVTPEISRQKDKLLNSGKSNGEDGTQTKARPMSVTPEISRQKDNAMTSGRPNIEDKTKMKVRPTSVTPEVSRQKDSMGTSDRQNTEERIRTKARPVSVTPEVSREKDRELLRKSAKTPTLGSVSEMSKSSHVLSSRPKSTTAEMLQHSGGSLRNAKSSAELQRSSGGDSGVRPSREDDLRNSSASVRGSTSEAPPHQKKTILKYMLHEVRELKRQVDPNAPDIVSARRHRRRGEGGSDDYGSALPSDEESGRPRSSYATDDEGVRSGTNSKSGSLARLNEEGVVSPGSSISRIPRSTLTYKQRLIARLQK